MKSDVFPVGLRLGGLRVLVVGGGTAAEDRVRALADAGARVVAVSEAPTPGLRELANRGTIELQVRAFADTDVAGCVLCVLTDLDPALAARMDSVTRERPVFFCAVDQP